MDQIIEDKSSNISYRVWLSLEPRCTLLLVHGLGAHSGRWAYLAEFLLKHNVSSYAIELKGFGETKSPKGHINSLNTYLEDIKALRNIIIKENPGKKVFLLGESMGGLLAFLGSVKLPELFDGAICMSPAFKSRLKFSIPEYLHIFLTFIWRPKDKIRVRFDSMMCTRDTAYQKIMDNDPREHRSASIKLLVNLAIAQVYSGKLKNKVKMPLLFLIPGEDKIVDSEFSEKFFNGIKYEDKGMISYPGMYHALSIDLGKEKVFEDILKWIGNRS